MTREPPVHEEAAEQTFKNLPWFAKKRKLSSVPCRHCGSETREDRYSVHAYNVEFMRILQDFGRPIKKIEIPKPRISSNAYADGTKVWRWGLIVSEGDGNRGPWRLTKRGRRFLAGKVSVPKYCVVLMIGGNAHSETVRYEGPAIHITDIAVENGEAIYREKVADIREARGKSG